MPVNETRPLSSRIRAAWNERVLILKAASFAAVGVINSLIDFCVFWVLVQSFDTPLIPANVMSWLVAITNSYVMNSRITFARESGKRLHWRSYATFVCAGIAGLVVNTTTLVTAVNLLPRVIENPAYQLAIAKLCAIMASFVVNFTLSYFVVFRRKRAGSY